MTPPHEMNYCPRCGERLMTAFTFGDERRTCPACKFVHFHDPKVAAVVFIVRDGKVLLVKRGIEPGLGKWALPAGYIDAHEDPREAAVREVKEETGLTVQITDLLDVTTPVPSDKAKASILILFEASVIGGSIRPRDDAVEAVFFTPETIPADQIAFNSTRMLLEAWLSREAASTEYRNENL